jgi:hypothetical protein
LQLFGVFGADAGASVKVNRTPVTSEVVSDAIPLTEGANPITIEVTAADGTTKKTYTVIVTRAAAISGGDVSNTT